MKKKIYIIPVIFLIGLVFINAVIVKADFTEKEKNSIQLAYETGDDGWEYAFKIYLYKNKENKYMFNGYNMKYEELEGFYIPVKDMNTGELLDKIKPSAITLSVSEKYSEDIKKISEYFTEKQFVKKITEKEVQDLTLKYIDKNFVVKLFNKAVVSKKNVGKGKFPSSKLFDKVYVNSTNPSMKGKWRISYLIDHGYVSKIYIDFINEKGKYLKEKNKYYDKSTKIITDLEIMENELENIANDGALENFEIDASKYSEISEISIKDLNKLIKKVTNKLKVNK